MYAAKTTAVAEPALRGLRRTSSVLELHRLAKTMSKWRTKVLAHHLTGASNGPTEAVNLLIKKALRVVHGFRNLHNYRRLLLHFCVRWQTPAATSIRSCSPVGRVEPIILGLGHAAAALANGEGHYSNLDALSSENRQLD